MVCPKSGRLERAKDWLLAATLLAVLAPAASAQGLARGGNTTSAGSPAATGAGSRECAKAVAVATKDCVVGYGGSLGACAVMGMKGPGGPVGKTLTAGACILHGLDGVNCANSVGHAIQACRSPATSNTCAQLSSQVVGGSGKANTGGRSPNSGSGRDPGSGGGRGPAKK